MINLPPTQPHLHRHTQKARHTNAPRITHTRGPQTKLAILLGHVVRDLCKRAHIHQAAQQALPENNHTHDVVARYEVKHGVRSEQDEIGDLQEGGDV